MTDGFVKAVKMWIGAASIIGDILLQSDGIDVSYYADDNDYVMHEVHISYMDLAKFKYLR